METHTKLNKKILGYAKKELSEYETQINSLVINNKRDEIDSFFTNKARKFVKKFFRTDKKWVKFLKNFSSIEKEFLYSYYPVFKRSKGMRNTKDFSDIYLNFLNTLKKMETDSSKTLNIKMNKKDILSYDSRNPTDIRRAKNFIKDIKFFKDNAQVKGMNKNKKIEILYEKISKNITKFINQTEIDIENFKIETNSFVKTFMNNFNFAQRKEFIEILSKRDYLNLNNL